MTVVVEAPPQRARKGWDIALTIVFLVLALVAGLAGSIFAVISLAFIDTCPDGCSIDGAVNAQFAAVFAVVLIGVVGLIASIVLLATRRRAWWVALLTVVLIVLALIAGWVGYSFAVGA